MRTNRGSVQFGAFIEPAGIYLVEYNRERDGISVLRHQVDGRRVIGLADAGERVAGMIRSLGATESSIRAVIRGFGSTYQIMMLPPAEPSILGAVVRREVVRLNPEMESPRVDYVVGGELDRRKRPRHESGIPQREVFVGAAPELAIAAFGEELASAGVKLDHLTLLPRVIQRLYETADGAPQPTACFVDLPGGPVIAFFHEGQLRLVVEPPIGGEPDLTARIQTLAEHIDRGNLFLRQQFRGVELSRLLIAVIPEEESQYLQLLRTNLRISVDKFPGPVPQPSALMAMGAILDGEADTGLNLSPFAESPVAKAERERRLHIAIGAGFICALAILWAVFSVIQVLSLNRQVYAERKTADTRMTTLAPLRVVASRRQTNAQSLAYLQRVRNDGDHTQEFLRGLSRATPPGVQLLSVTMQRAGEEWNVTVGGTGYGETGADVLLGIDRFFHALPREMSIHDLVLAALSDVPPSQSGASAMRFSLTFVLSPPARAQ